MFKNENTPDVYKKKGKSELIALQYDVNFKKFYQ